MKAFLLKVKIVKSEGGPIPFGLVQADAHNSQLKDQRNY